MTVRDLFRRGSGRRRAVRGQSGLGSQRRVRRGRRLVVESLEPRMCLSLAVPALSSLPGAKHTIYLDFDGHVTTGTNWNSYFSNPTINSPAFDFDGNPTSFSAAESSQIENIWKRAAEDFIPFQVNVTTVNPGLEALRKSGKNDTDWGVRAVITTNTEGCACSGVGYINSFNWNSDTPVFIYLHYDGDVAARVTADVISHEVGHSLGLAHDGTATAEYYGGHGSGATGWGPIMGSAFKEVSQWDKGEYYGSDNGGRRANYGNGPDDLAVITTKNGFGYRADDHGNTTATATTLAAAGPQVSGAGIIERTADVDFFRFSTAAGTVTLNVNPFTPSPNLDVRADLFNASGVLVATANPADVLSASLTVELAAGQYYLKVDGVGTGNPTVNPPTGYTDYASLGRYTITGTIVDAGAPALLAAPTPDAGSTSDGPKGKSGGAANGPSAAAESAADGSASSAALAFSDDHDESAPHLLPPINLADLLAPQTQSSHPHETNHAAVNVLLVETGSAAPLSDSVFSSLASEPTAWRTRHLSSRTPTTEIAAATAIPAAASSLRKNQPGGQLQSEFESSESADEQDPVTNAEAQAATSELFATTTTWLGAV